MSLQPYRHNLDDDSQLIESRVESWPALAASPNLFFSSPISIEEQRTEVARVAKSVSYTTDLGFYYLPIEDIISELGRIFGPDNVGFSDEHIQWRQGEPTQKGDPKVICRIQLRLFVRWAHGGIQSWPGTGIAYYFPKSARANEAATESIARSEAIKSAAKYIGPRFRVPGDDDVRKGLLEEEASGVNKAILTHAIGQRLVLDAENNQEVLMTEAILRAMCKQHIGASLDDLDAKGLSVMSQIIQSLPTPEDRKNLEVSAIRLKIDFIGVDYETLRHRVSQKLDNLI